MMFYPKETVSRISSNFLFKNLKNNSGNTARPNIPKKKLLKIFANDVMRTPGKKNWRSNFKSSDRTGEKQKKITKTGFLRMVISNNYVRPFPHTLTHHKSRRRFFKTLKRWGLCGGLLYDN